MKTSKTELVILKTWESEGAMAVRCCGAGFSSQEEANEAARWYEAGLSEVERLNDVRLVICSRKEAKVVWGVKRI